MPVLAFFEILELSLISSTFKALAALLLAGITFKMFTVRLVEHPLPLKVH